MDVLDTDSIAAAMAGVSAVICATGFTPSLNFKKDNPAKVDHVGTDNLVAAATAEGASVKRFVLVTSLLTNAKAAGQANNDNYKFLNALGGVLDEKLAAELNLRASGLDYVIVRPGGLSNEPPETVGELIVRGEDTTFGLESDPGREISRDTVAAVCVEALFDDKAAKRVVEMSQAQLPPHCRLPSGLREDVFRGMGVAWEFSMMITEILNCNSKNYLPVYRYGAACTNCVVQDPASLAGEGQPRAGTRHNTWSGRETRPPLERARA